MNEFGNQAASAIAVSYFIEVLKSSNHFNFINEESAKKIKVLIGAIAALITTVGISYTFDYDQSSGGSLVLHLPALHVFLDYFKQWAFQEFVYNVGVRGKSTKA